MVVVSFIGGGNWSAFIIRKPDQSQVTDKLDQMMYRVHIAMNRVQTHNCGGDKHTKSIIT